MPTKRTRRKRGRQGDISTAAWYFINDELYDEIRKQANPFDILELECSTPPHNELLELWSTNREAVLKRWLLLHPGTRPNCWWLIDAPQLSIEKQRYSIDSNLSKFIKEPRKQLSGVGTPLHDALSIVQSCKYGIPSSWISGFDVEYYNGIAKDIHGNLINAKANQGDFKGVAIDPNDPPLFESQATYLDRFGLLSAAEKKKSNFNPESVIDVIGSHLINPSTINQERNNHG